MMVRCLLLGANPTTSGIAKDAVVEYSHGLIVKQPVRPGLNWIYPVGELQNVKQQLRAAEYPNGLQIQIRQDWTRTNLKDLLEGYKPALVHICGHVSDAGFEAEDGIIKNFCPYFAYKGPPRCVVLSGCNTQDLAKDLSQIVDCVIGTSDTITGELIRPFLDAFYSTIGTGANVIEAFEKGNGAFTGAEDKPSMIHIYQKSGAKLDEIIFVSSNGLGVASDEARRWKQLHKDWQNVQLQVVLLWKLMQLPDLENTLIDFECLWPACRRRLRQLRADKVPELESFYRILVGWESRLDSFGLRCQDVNDLCFYHDDIKQVLSNTMQSLTEMLTLIDGKLQRILTDS